MLNTKKLIKDLENITNPTDLNNKFASFCNLIKDELTDTNRRSTRFGASPKPWWNQTLSKYRKDLRKAQKNWLKCSGTNPDRVYLWKIFKDKQKSFDKLVRQEKRKFNNHRHTDLLKHLNHGKSHKFWKLFDRIRIANDHKEHSLPKSLLNPNGNLISDHTETKDIWLNYFKNLLNPQLSHSNSLDISNLEYNLVTTNPNHILIWKLV